MAVSLTLSLEKPYVRPAAVMKKATTPNLASPKNHFRTLISHPPFFSVKVLFRWCLSYNHYLYASTAIPYLLSIVQCIKE